MSFGKKYSFLSIGCAGFIFLLFGIAYGSTLNDIRTEIKHANTCFWFGIAEQGNMDSFYKGLNHIHAAEKILKSVNQTKKPDETDELSSLEIQLKALHKDLINQMEVHFDTMYGVFPLVRLLTPTIFSDVLTLGTFELVDDPAVMASTSAGSILAQEVLLKWSRKPQLNVIFNSNTGEELRHKKPNPALEQEILYVFGSLPKFFVHHSQEIRKFLTKEEYEIFQNGFEPFQHKIIKKICTKFDCQDLLVVSVNENDVIENDQFYIAQGHLYNIEKKDPIHTFSQMGFSRDRNKYFWPLIFSFFIGLGISIFFFALVKSKWKIKNIFNTSGKHMAVPIIAYLIGRIVPWGLVPILSKITPMPETLFFISFWWPCLAGVVFFLVPVLIYLQFNKFLYSFDKETFKLPGNGSAILLSISIGVSFYLINPFMLYWDSLIGFFRITCISLISGYIFYWFGVGLNKGLFKINSTTVKSGIYLFPILFVFGGAMFYGDTFPIRDYWHTPHKFTGLCLLFLPLILAVLYHMYIVTLTKEIVSGPGPEPEDDDLIDDANLTLMQQIVRKIKASNYDYWESDKFKKNIRPLIDPFLDNKTVSFKTIWLKITGTDGCGKSAAANALIKLIKNSNNKIIQFSGQCRRKTMNEIAETPYEPFHDALPSYLIEPLLVSHDLFFHPANMVPSFIGLDSFFSQLDKDTAEAMDEQIQQAIFEDIADYLRKKAENNIVIISLDNMHEIDSASKKLLAFLQKQFTTGQKSSLLFIIITNEINDPFKEMKNFSRCEIDNPNAKDLAEVLIHSFSFEENSAKMISKKINPLRKNKFSAMLYYILKLVEDGQLEEHGEDKYKLIKKYTNGNYEDLPTPANYIEIIARQYRKFDEKQIKILSYAACLGMNFSIEIISQCLKDDTIIQILEEIENISGFVFDNHEEDGCFSFRDFITLEQTRKKLGITFEGPPWNGVKEKIKNIHGKLAHYFLKKSEKETDCIFDACIHLYASGGQHVKQTIQSCFVAADCGKKQYNFDLAKDYIKMAVECANHLGKPMNIEEELLLIDCEKAHIQGLNSSEMANKCIDYYELNKEKVSNKILKIMARVCYEAVRDIDRFFDHKKYKYGSNREKYKNAGNTAIQLLLNKTTDKFSKAETYFYKAINEDEQINKISDLKLCISVLGSINSTKDQKVETLLSWAEDQLARQLELQNPMEAIQLFQSCIKRKEWLDDKPGLSRSLGGLGTLFLSLKEKQYIQARECYQESMNYAQQVSDDFGEYQRNYELGNSYLIEAENNLNNSELFQKALEYFYQGIKIVNKFDESNGNKDRSFCFLFSGIMFCKANLADWNGFNQYGNTLFELIKQESRFPEPELIQRIQSAIEIGAENANEWAVELEKKLIK